MSERIDQFQHVADDDNEDRFASLGVLHGWISFSDRQFLYETAAPFRVSAVDHGHFFPSGPNWTVATLAAAAAPTVAADLITACALQDADLAAACAPLTKITDEEIARIIGIPPTAWGVTIDERIAVAKYVSARRATMLDKYSAKKAAKQ